MGNKAKCTSGNREKGEESFSEGALEFTTVPSAVQVVAELKEAFMLSEKPFSLNKMDVISSSRLWRGQKRKSKELAMSQNWQRWPIERKWRLRKKESQSSIHWKKGEAICLWPFAWMLAFHRLKAVHSCSLQKCTKLSGFSLKLYHKLSMTDPPAYQMLLCIILRELLGLGLSACNSLFQGPSTCYTYFSVRPYVPNPLPPTLLTRHSGPCQFRRHSEVLHMAFTISAPMISPFPIPLCPYHKHCDSNPLKFPQIC